MADPLDPLAYIIDDEVTRDATLAAMENLCHVRGLPPITADTHPDEETEDHKRANYEALVAVCSFMKHLAEDPATADRTAADLWGEMTGEKYPE